MDRNELPLDKCHLGVPSDVPKMISEPIARSAQILHLSCMEINTISKWTKTSFHFTNVTGEVHCVQPKNFHARGTFGANCAPILHQDSHRLRADQSELPLDPHHLGVPLGAPKMIYEPIACLAQMGSLSCVEISTISKETKRASIYPTSPRSSIGSAQKDFRAYSTFSATVHYLACWLTLSPNRAPISFDPHHLGGPSGVAKKVSLLVVHFAQTMHLFGAKINTFSMQTKKSLHLT
jgi:hypothetical protein